MICEEKRGVDVSSNKGNSNLLVIKVTPKPVIIDGHWIDWKFKDETYSKDKPFEGEDGTSHLIKKISKWDDLRIKAYNDKVIIRIKTKNIPLSIGKLNLEIKEYDQIFDDFIIKVEAKRSVDANPDVFTAMISLDESFYKGSGKEKEGEFIFNVSVSYKNEDGREIYLEKKLPKISGDRLVVQKLNGRYSTKDSGGIAGREKFKIDEGLFLYDEDVKMERDMVDNLKNADYWKKFIKVVSNGKLDVDKNRSLINTMPESEYYWRYVLNGKLKELGTKFQFYLIKDGFEGFLPPNLTIKWQTKHEGDVRIYHDFTNADRVRFYNHLGGNEKPPKGAQEYFDANDALVIFDKEGKIVDVLLILTRYNGKTDQKKFSEKRKRNRWNNRMVYLAMPENPGYNYRGLSVFDHDNDSVDIYGMLGSRGCYQVCPVHPDGKATKKPWNDFVKSFFPENWRQILNDTRVLYKAKDFDNVVRYKLGHMWIAGY